MMALLYIVLGVIGLVLGSNLIVSGVSNLARHFKISPLFLGLTIVAFGTDLPELVVSITAAIQRLQGNETSGIVIGNVIGSCMGQMGLSLGILGLFATLEITKRRLSRDGLMAVISVIVLLLASWDGVLTRKEGIVMLLIFALYFHSLLREEKIQDKITRAPKMYPGWIALSIAGGFAILIYSSHVVVTYAQILATAIGVTQTWIGIVIVGIGTSLPELAVSMNAIFKKSYDLSIGNLIGSNIFDLLFIPGTAGIIAEVTVQKEVLSFHLPFLFLTSLMALYFFSTRLKLQYKEALLLLSMFTVYLGITVIIGLAI